MKPVKLLTGLFLAGASVFLMSCQKADSPDVVGELQCKFQQNPFGIDRAESLLQ